VKRGAPLEEPHPCPGIALRFIETLLLLPARAALPAFLNSSSIWKPSIARYCLINTIPF
jgi:hypothetical protein